MLSVQRLLARNLKKVRFLSNSNVLTSKEDETNETHKHVSGKEKSKTGKISKEEVTMKLNNLLQDMVKKDAEPPREVKVPQAVKHEKVVPAKEKPFGEKLAHAAKDVATSLGGDVKKTESELLNILLKRSGPDTQILKDVLSGMKVDKEAAYRDSRAKQVRDTLASHPKAAQLRMEKSRRKDGTRKAVASVDILGAQPCSYFADLKPAPAPCELSTWDSCEQRDLRLASTHPPSNIYEQMIQWTDRGMIWHFPIDNEQGMDSEKQVSFEEHVFLEVHLEGWCPEKGPVRHFMELVCVGLSKNHWLSAEEKKNHIYWFRDYFADKQELLKEIGAGTINVESNEQKQISQ